MIAANLLFLLPLASFASAASTAGSPLLLASSLLWVVSELPRPSLCTGLRGSSASHGGAGSRGGPAIFEAGFAAAAGDAVSSVDGGLHSLVRARLEGRGDLADFAGVWEGTNASTNASAAITPGRSGATGTREQDEREVQLQQGAMPTPTVSGGVGQRLLRVGRLMDVDGDARLSAEEMRLFAQGLRERQRWNQTSEAFLRLDANKNGGVEITELGLQRAGADDDEGAVAASLREHHERRFRAADRDGDRRLSLAELHAFAHPEVDDRTFAVVRAHQLALFDTDGSGSVDLEEFRRETAKRNEDDFDEGAALEDFQLHDADVNGRLDAGELGDLLLGHNLLESHIQKTLEAADGDSDGHLHLEEELLGSLQSLLESEFVEDYFLHEHAESGRRWNDEL